MTAGVVVLSHSSAEGTLVQGTARGDGSGPVLKAAGLRWGRSLGCWFVPRSRDQPPRVALIERVAADLRAVGLEVAVEVDEAPRPVAVVEAALADRADERAGRLERSAVRHAQVSETHRRAREAISDRIPMGQPVLLGHHSQRRHQKDLARIDTHLRAEFGHDEISRENARRAEVAGRRVESRNNPGTVARRIARLEAEQRRITAMRDRTGHCAGLAELGAADAQRCTAEVERLAAELAHWHTIRQDQVATGTATAYGPSDITVGDLICRRSSWYRVTRVNPKSVSVHAAEDPRLCIGRIAYPEITDHRTTS